jgi:glucose-1-phosphate thymidylyltransferase
MLLKENNKITYNMITDYWKDTGTPEDIIHANGAVLEKMKPYFFGKKQDRVTLEGKIMVGKGTIIKSGSKIVGPVIIGKNCTIEPDTVIGPNTSIGDNSLIAMCDINNSIVMNDCKIQCKVKIRDSIIAYNSTIVYDQTKQNEKVFLLGEGTKIII